MPVDTAHARAGGRPLPPRAATDPPGTTPRPGDPAASAPTELAPDAAKHLEKARKLAWRSLNRRERTAAELRERLAVKEIEPWAIDQVVDELREQRYVDDAGYAQRFADDRRRLDGWGPERIERRLRALGIRGEELAAALDRRGAEDELDAALALLARRFPEPPATPRDAQRALGMLVRKGYGLELAHDALRRHAGASEFD
jgi:regulatory protein